MALAPVLLGQIPGAGDLRTWLLMQLSSLARPALSRLGNDFSGTLSWCGDLIFWQGEKGKHVIATLEGLSDKQERIEQVVGKIDRAQIGLVSSLGTLTHLSMATLGVTCLAAGYMLWRLEALNKRLLEVIDLSRDNHTLINAQCVAPLLASLTFLKRFERLRSGVELRSALDKSVTAMVQFREVVNGEIEGQRRPVALNLYGRYYLLALTTYARCNILSRDRNQLDLVSEALGGESPTLTALGRTLFQEVMGKAPEVYLDPKLQPEGVTLSLLTEIYQKAHRLDAAIASEVKDAGAMFEQLRKRVYGAGGVFGAIGKAKEKMLTRLKYLMAGLEELERIESLRMRIDEARAGRLSFEKLETAVAQACKRTPFTPGDGIQTPIVAFALA